MTALVEAIIADAIEAAALEFPERSSVLGAVHARPRRATSARPCRRSAIASTASAAGRTSASRRSATCRWRSATPVSTRCASGTGRPRPRSSSLYRDVTVAADEYLAGVGRRPDPGRDGDDARPPGRRPGRGLEPVGPDPAAPARGGLTAVGSNSPRQPGPSSSSSSMTTTRRPSAAAAPIGAPSSAAQARIRSRAPRRRGSGWRARAGRRSCGRSSPATSTQVSAGPTRRGRPAGPRARPARRAPATGRPSGCGRPGRRRRTAAMPGGAMVGVVDPAAAVEDRLGIGREDGVRAERPDLADELLAQREVVGERAVGLVQEGHAGIADDRGRRPLLGLAQGGQLERVGVRVLAALVAARAAHQPALGALVDPAGGRRGRAEIGIVGVGGDDHEPGGSPGVVARGRRRSSRGVRRAPSTLRRSWPARTFPAEASLVSPHERSLRASAAVMRGAAWSSSSAASTSRGMTLGLDLGPDPRDPTVRIDQERRPRRAHVGLAVVLLLDPRPVGLGDRVALVGEQRERQVELLAEGALARGSLRADAPDVGATLVDGRVAVAELARLDGAAGRVVLG